MTKLIAFQMMGTSSAYESMLIFLRSWCHFSSSAVALLVGISKFRHFLHQSYNFLRASRSIAKTGLQDSKNGGLKMRSKKVLKKWFQRVPKWTPKVDQHRQKGCSGGVPKRDLKKLPSPGPGKVRFCIYLLHFSKVRALRKGSFWGTILESILETKSWTQGSRAASKKTLNIDTHCTRFGVNYGGHFWVKSRSFAGRRWV